MPTFNPRRTPPPLLSRFNGLQQKKTHKNLGVDSKTVFFPPPPPLPPPSPPPPPHFVAVTFLTWSLLIHMSQESNCHLSAVSLSETGFIVHA